MGRKTTGIAVLFLMAPFAARGETASTVDGAALYQRCAVCHQSDARGIPEQFPPLEKRLSALALHQPGRDYLVMVLETGLMGPIQVEGARYDSVMPPQAAGLGDDGVATVLNYVLARFNQMTSSKAVQPYTAAEVGEIKGRYPNTTMRDTHALRQSVIPGAEAKGIGNAGKAEYHWIMHCRGCHGPEAHGIDGGAPRMAGFVSRFVNDLEGREFLARVPGVALSELADRDLAELLNWMLQRFDPEHLSQGFEPYTEAEIRSLRERPLILQIPQERQRIVRRLEGGG